jgi:mRNA interferase MazF
VVGAPHPSRDVIIVPLTSRTQGLQPGEFVLAGWQQSGLRVATAAKRGVFTIHGDLVLKVVGTLSPADATHLQQSLRDWLALAE